MLNLTLPDPEQCIAAQVGLDQVLAKVQVWDPLWVVNEQGEVIGKISSQSLLPWVGRALPGKLCARDVMQPCSHPPAQVDPQQALWDLLNHRIPGYFQRLIWDPENQSFSFAFISAGVERVLRLSREELGANFQTLMETYIHPQDREQVRQELRDLVEHRGSAQSVLRILTPTQEVRWLQSYSQTHVLESHGLAIDSLLVDITDRHHTELINSAIIQAIPDLLVHLDREGRCLRVLNGHSARLLQLEFQPGDPKADVLPPEIATLWTEAISACLATGKMQTFEQSLTILGQRQYESVRIVPLDADSVLAVIRDRTARKVAELVLQESEARFRLLAENATDMIATKTPEGVYTYVSPACHKLLGYTPDQMVGTSAYAFFHPEEIPALQEYHRELFIQNQVRITHRMRHHNQDYIWVESSIRLIRDPDTQAPLEIQVVVRDIRERIAYEQELRLANEQLRYEVDVRNAQLRQALMIESLLRRITEEIRTHLDTASIITKTVHLLGETLQLYGCQVGLYDPDALTFTAEYEWFSQPQVSATVGIPCPVNPTSVPQIARATSLHYSTHHAFFGPITLLVCPIRDPNQPQRLLKLFRLSGDSFTPPEIGLAEQVAQQCVIGIRQACLWQQTQDQIKKLQEANEIKDDFLHMVSHELRTPLTNMKMALTMLQNIRDPQRQEHYFRILHKAWQQELNLVNELLELQALESGSLVPKIETLSLPTWLEEITHPFWQRCQSQQQEFILDCQICKEIIATDPGLLERIVLELLNNACKYTPAREKITLAVQSKDSQMLVQVTNTGVTIPPAEQKRVFQKFHRLPHLDHFNHGGTGLGLPLVKKAVECLGGQIRLYSDNQETCFSITLPC